MSNSERGENKEVLLSERVTNAQKSLEAFLKLKPEEKVLILTDNKTNSSTLEIMKKAIEGIKCDITEFELNKKIKRDQVQKLLAKNQVVVDLTVDSHKSSQEVLDEDLDKYKYRLLALYDLAPDAFDTNGPLSEDFEALQERLNRMEAILHDAVGFKITSTYGTNLDVPLRPFKERRWVKDAGMIDRPGQWNNLPGGEIYTTPDETKVNGRLVLPVLESTITADQGVDEFVTLEIKNGLITSIQGGQSAQMLEKEL
ncbi:aminopeptidase, partial [Patescibacteria group bacterium]|nr:aminopeptidase [Patescibacteria group bacterium]